MPYFYFVTVVDEGPDREIPEWRPTSFEYKFNAVLAWSLGQ